MNDMEKAIKGLQIERECVSRDCDRDCGKCDLVQEREWLLSVYDDAIAMLKEQEEQIKTRDESLEKAREEIKWLRGMLKEQEAVKPKIDAFGHPYCPKCKILVYETWEFCPHCGQAVKWDA